MTVHVRHARVVLRLPVMPRKYARGDVRNYRRWHCWVEAVKVLAAHYKGNRWLTPDGAKRKP